MNGHFQCFPSRFRYPAHMPQIHLRTSDFQKMPHYHRPDYPECPAPAFNPYPGRENGRIKRHRRFSAGNKIPDGHRSPSPDQFYGIPLSSISCGRRPVERSAASAWRSRTYPTSYLGPYHLRHSDTLYSSSPSVRRQPYPNPRGARSNGLHNPTSRQSTFSMWKARKTHVSSTLRNSSTVDTNPKKNNVNKVQQSKVVSPEKSKVENCDFVDKSPGKAITVSKVDLKDENSDKNILERDFKETFRETIVENGVIADKDSANIPFNNKHSQIMDIGDNGDNVRITFVDDEQSKVTTANNYECGYLEQSVDEVFVNGDLTNGNPVVFIDSEKRNAAECNTSQKSVGKVPENAVSRHYMLRKRLTTATNSQKPGEEILEKSELGGVRKSHANPDVMLEDIDGENPERTGENALDSKGRSNETNEHGDDGNSRKHGDKNLNIDIVDNNLRNSVRNNDCELKDSQKIWPNPFQNHNHSCDDKSSKNEGRQKFEIESNSLCDQNLNNSIVSIDKSNSEIPKDVHSSCLLSLTPYTTSNGTEGSILPTIDSGSVDPSQKLFSNGLVDDEEDTCSEEFNFCFDERESPVFCDSLLEEGIQLKENETLKSKNDVVFENGLNRRSIRSETSEEFLLSPTFCSKFTNETVQIETSRTKSEFETKTDKLDSVSGMPNYENYVKLKKNSNVKQNGFHEAIQKPTETDFDDFNSKTGGKQSCRTNVCPEIDRIYSGRGKNLYFELKNDITANNNKHLPSPEFEHMDHEVSDIPGTNKNNVNSSTPCDKLLKTIGCGDKVNNSSYEQLVCAEACELFEPEKGVTEKRNDQDVVMDVWHSQSDGEISPFSSPSVNHFTDNASDYSGTVGSFSLSDEIYVENLLYKVKRLFPQKTENITQDLDCSYDNSKSVQEEASEIDCTGCSRNVSMNIGKDHVNPEKERDVRHNARNDGKSCGKNQGDNRCDEEKPSDDSDSNSQKDEKHSCSPGIITNDEKDVGGVKDISECTSNGQNTTNMGSFVACPSVTNSQDNKNIGGLKAISKVTSTGKRSGDIGYTEISLSKISDCKNNTDMVSLKDTSDSTSNCTHFKNSCSLEICLGTTSGGNDNTNFGSLEEILESTSNCKDAKTIGILEVCPVKTSDGQKSKTIDSLKDMVENTSNGKNSKNSGNSEICSGTTSNGKNSKNISEIDNTGNCKTNQENTSNTSGGSSVIITDDHGGNDLDNTTRKANNRGTQVSVRCVDHNENEFDNNKTVNENIKQFSELGSNPDRLSRNSGHQEDVTMEKSSPDFSKMVNLGGLKVSENIVDSVLPMEEESCSSETLSQDEFINGSEGVDDDFRLHLCIDGDSCSSMEQKPDCLTLDGYSSGSTTTIHSEEQNERNEGSTKDYLEALKITLVQQLDPNSGDAVWRPSGLVPKQSTGDKKVYKKAAKRRIEACSKSQKVQQSLSSTRSKTKRRMTCFEDESNFKNPESLVQLAAGPLEKYIQSQEENYWKRNSSKKGPLSIDMHDYYKKRKNTLPVGDAGTIRLGNFETMYEIAKKKFGVDQVKRGRPSPRGLYLAAKQGNVLQVLLHGAGCNVNNTIPQENHKTAMHAAAGAGHLPTLHILHMIGGSLSLLDCNLRTPLFDAVEHHQIAVVKFLIEKNVNLGLKDLSGMTVLHIAAKKSYVDIINLLMETRAIDIDEQDCGGWTALMWSAESKHIDAAKCLLKWGASVYLQDNEHNTCLHWAAISGAADILDLFVLSNANIDSTNMFGATALHISARERRLLNIKVLEKYNANIELKDADGKTPLQLAPFKSKCYSALENLQNLHNFRKTSMVERLVTSDVSRGQELRPVPCVNEVDDEDLPVDFIYVHKSCEGPKTNFSRTCMTGCNCTNGCENEKRCECAQLSARKRFWYDETGLICGEIFRAKDRPLVYECNIKCKCWATCSQRVVQHGVKVSLQVYKTKHKGWAVRSQAPISQGAFVCEYVGEILTDAEANKRDDDSYLFDLDVDGKDTELLCLDAKYYGNVSRFINHSCDPNVLPVRVFTDHQVKRCPRIAFFASRPINPYEEICSDYGKRFWKVKKSEFNCVCNTSKCKYKDSVAKKKQNNL